LVIGLVFARTVGKKKEKIRHLVTASRTKSHLSAGNFKKQGFFVINLIEIKKKYGGGGRSKMEFRKRSELAADRRKELGLPRGTTSWGKMDRPKSFKQIPVDLRCRIEERGLPEVQLRLIGLSFFESLKGPW